MRSDGRYNARQLSLAAKPNSRSHLLGLFGAGVGCAQPDVRNHNHAHKKNARRS